MNMRNWNVRGKSGLFNRLPGLWKQYWVKVFQVLTKSAWLLSVSKPQNHNKNTERSNAQPAQRLLSCLFCLLSGRRESHREGGRGGERERAWIFKKKTAFIPVNWKDKQGVTLLWRNKRQVLNSEERVMLVLKISDPCPAANPKQIPFQAAHLVFISSSISTEGTWHF